MTTTTATLPNGICIENPTLDQLRPQVLTPDPGWWIFKGNDAELGLDFLRPDGVSAISLRYKQSHGFHVSYFRRLGQLPFGVLDYEIAVAGDNNLLVDLKIISIPEKFPQFTFVSPEKAWIAVEEFLKSGEASGRLTWRRWSHILNDLPEDIAQEIEDSGG